MKAIKRLFRLNRYFMFVYHASYKGESSGYTSSTLIVRGGSYPGGKALIDEVRRINKNIETCALINIIELSKSDFNDLNYGKQELKKT